MGTSGDNMKWNVEYPCRQVAVYSTSGCSSNEYVLAWRLFSPANAADWFNKGCVMLSCLYGIHVLNRDFNMIQTNKQRTIVDGIHTIIGCTLD